MNEIIVKLIEQDIQHNQLLNGLEEIGLTDNDKYTLSIDLIVADLMGYPETKVPDKWLEAYHKLMLTIPYYIDGKEAHRRALILFEVLSSI
jgi:hypothetical protein